MHRPLPLVLALLMLPGLAAAQEGFELLPGRASGPTPGITLVLRTPNAVTEMLQQYDARYVCGVGDRRPAPGATASPCEVDAVSFVYQDQDASTPEPLDIVARAESTTTPGASDAEIFRQSLPAAPTGPASPRTFRRTVQLMGNAPYGTAIPVPCTGTWFFGLEIPLVPPNKTWPNDGLAIAASFALTAAPNMIFDWPKGGATSAYLYDLWTGGSGGRRFAERMVFAVNLLTGDAPNLQVGAVHIPMTSPSGADINFGAAGIFPEINPNNPTSPGRHDGTAVRITDNNSGGGSYGLFASVNQNAKTQNLPIISLPGLAGGVYLGSVLYPVLGGILAATGPDTIVTLAPPRTLPASCVGSTVYFQAFTLSGTPSRAALTNLAGVAYAP